MVGSIGCLREPSLASDLDGKMACQGWEFSVARTVNGLLLLPELGIRILLQ